MTDLFLLDVRVDPVGPVPWGDVIFLLLIVFVLAVSLIAGLVFWFGGSAENLAISRRKLNRERYDR